MNNNIVKNESKPKDDTIRKIPVLHIRMMTDEEWNRLAYRNYLERKAVAV